MESGEIQLAISKDLQSSRFERESELVELNRRASSNFGRCDSNPFGGYYPQDQSKFEEQEDFQVSEELAALQLELWQLRQAELYNKEKGLKKCYFDKIKKMKIGHVKKCCSICFLDFEKNEKIRKLPCSHIYHEGCIKNWLNVNTNCPMCRLNLNEYFEKEESQNFKSESSLSQGLFQEKGLDSSSSLQISDRGIRNFQPFQFSEQN